MERKVPREYPEAENQKEILYIYDRICPKQHKKEQIRRTYGVPGPTPTGGRSFGKAFAQAQKQRARTARPHTPGAASAGARPRTAYASERARPRMNGGAAVRERPLKLLLEHLINLFESMEERGRRDEALAKKNAIARKKFSEYRHSLVTALVLLLVTAGFVFLVYKVFFVIEKVQIDGSDRYSEEELLDAAGFSVGDNLYSFSAADCEDSMTFLCPYIRSAEVKRTIPKQVAVTVEDDEAVYQAVIWGDRVKLSAGLRVLEVLEPGEKADGLLELVLPPVQYSVAGRMLVFRDERDSRYIRSVLEEVRLSDLSVEGRLVSVDLSDEYDIRAVAENRYLLRLGGETDCDLKLRMAYRTMNDPKFDRLLPAQIDLTEVGRATVKPDAQLTFDGE